MLVVWRIMFVTVVTFEIRCYSMFYLFPSAFGSRNILVQLNLELLVLMKVYTTYKHKHDLPSELVIVESFQGAQAIFTLVSLSQEASCILRILTDLNALFL